MVKAFKRLVAVSLVLSNKAYLAAFLATLVISFAAYSYLFGNSSLNLAEPKLFLGLGWLALAVAVLMSVLLSLSITMSAFAIFNRTSCNMKLGVASVVSSVIPLTLCCTTIIPSILALLGASTFTIIGIAGQIQGPLATYEAAFILASIGLLLLSVSLTSKQIIKHCKVDKHEN